MGLIHTTNTHTHSQGGNINMVVRVVSATISALILRERERVLATTIETHAQHAYIELAIGRGADAKEKQKRR